MIPSIEQRITRLQNGFDSVESPLQLADFKGKAITKATMAYVFLTEERPTNTKQDSAGHTQEVQCTVTIVMGIKSVNDPKNLKGNAKLQQKREALKNSLCGWIPEGADTALIFKGSKLLAMAANGIWWTEQFTFTYFLNSPYQADW